ncbi:MAG TPA: acetate--CoA ligase family protein [Caulobacteraceae bacterium]|nr:acetate--CoA ligase family protein [Caulobacteraceae bacterium]
MAQPSALPLDRLLRPRSVAIVGASEKPGALGAALLANLERAGFTGDIHLINPNRAEIGGRPCLKSVDDLPEGVDAAVLAIPRPAVLDVIKALARRGVGSAIIFSSGFAEGGEAGMAEQREIAAVARAAGMVLEGPNCLGMVNFIDGIPLTFVEPPAPTQSDGDRIGIVSQSGAMATVLMVTLASRTLPLSLSISTGNEAASGVEDYVEYLVDHPETKVISMIVEQFRQPQRFLRAARRARDLGKTIVLLHPGKSGAARQSAATHTGALAGDYQTMRLFVRRAGVVMAETLEELGDISEIALRCGSLPEGGVAVLGESGAFKALTLDLCEELDLSLPELTDANAPQLRAAMPEFVAVSNPLDLTAQGLVDPGIYQRTLAVLLEDDRFGAVVVGIIQEAPRVIGIKAPPILAAMAGSDASKPVVFAGLDEGAEVPAAIIAALRDASVPYFPTAERALRAIKRLGAVDRRPVTAPPPLAAIGGLAGGIIPEYKAKAALAPLGVSFPPGRFVRTLEEAQAAAADLGFPVVLKAQSADLSHKSDAGGVILSLKDAEGLAEGWSRLAANIARARPGLVLDGVLVEGMGEGGIELIVGGRHDPDWGPVILVGFGGVLAEMLQDVRLLPPDLSREDIALELRALKCGALFGGYRGSPALDVDAVVDIVIALGSAMTATEQIREVDLNPVVVHPRGQGAVALDALITAERPSP